MAGKDAFLAPLMVIFPANGGPPLMSNLSMYLSPSKNFFLHISKG
jgi:hypothetical protein